MWLATHNEEIVKGILDTSNDRVVIVRLDRSPTRSTAQVLQPNQVKALWTDPLLRTSDVLSALFHDVAVICEGESDVRFLRALNDTIPTAVRLPDFRFYHVGGKDKIAPIASALRPLNLPVCVIVDMDILSEQSKFLALFEALGGSKTSVKEDLIDIIQQVTSKKSFLTAVEMIRELRRIAQSAEESKHEMNKIRAEMSSLISDTGAWERVKQAGCKALPSGSITQAFERVYNQALSVGMVINREGELEGLCRQIQKTKKGEWLSDVLLRNLATDPDLEDARLMLGAIRSTVIAMRDRELGTST